MVRNLIIIGTVLVTLPVFADELPGDPTKPSAFVSAKEIAEPIPVAQRQYTLSYLMVSKTRKVAVINDKRVTLGDQVDGAKVMEITPDGVRLRVGTYTKHLVVSQHAGFKKELIERKRN